jgi:Cdc6-like AAA superfamily ATPase
MNNDIIKGQCGRDKNYKLSYLYFLFESIPFDNMPFISSPHGHNPRLGALFSCIPTYNREHELLARKIKNNSEIQGYIFSNVDEIVGYNDLENLKRIYNMKLYEKHVKKSKLVIEKGQIYLNEYKTDTCTVIEKLKEMTISGIEGYTFDIDFMIDLGAVDVDCDEKKDILLRLFSESRVAMIYGSAGVGKTTLIKQVSDYFFKEKKLFLTQTNSAKNNLEMQIKDEQKHFFYDCKFYKQKQRSFPRMRTFGY